MPIKSLIRTVPDYPKPGIQFRDVTTLLKDPAGLHATIQALLARYMGQTIHKIVGIESRGFIIGAPLAYALGIGFIPVRKPGKLPGETFSQDYVLECAFVIDLPDIGGRKRLEGQNLPVYTLCEFEGD